VIYPELVGSST
jgi:hypothetical protein